MINMGIQPVSETLNGGAVTHLLQRLGRIENCNMVMMKWIFPTLQPERQLNFGNFFIEIFHQLLCGGLPFFDISPRFEKIIIYNRKAHDLLLYVLTPSRFRVNCE